MDNETIDKKVCIYALPLKRRLRQEQEWLCLQKVYEKCDHPTEEDKCHYRRIGEVYDDHEG